MYDSIQDEERFEKPSKGITGTLKALLISPIKAPDDIFQQKDSDSQGEEYLSEDGTDIPETFRSSREERIYLGRGYNRLGLKKTA